MSNTATTRANAKAALDLYHNKPGNRGNDEPEAITDLIVDLLHYADRSNDCETDGPDILHMVTVHYDAERTGDSFYTPGVDGD